MEDKETQVEGQELASPETIETPASDPETTESPTGEVDKDLSDWATNKGYSEEDLQNPAVLKAVKMAKNAESFVGKPAANESDSADDVDVDALLNDLFNEGSSPVQKEEAAKSLGKIDESTLSEADRATLAILREEARKEAKAVFAPYESELRKQSYRAELDSLTKEFGPDVIKKAPQILAKTKTGTSLRDAVISSLMEDRLKAERSNGISEGKQIKAREIAQQVEQPKKTGSNPSTDEFNKLSLAEQEQVLIALQSKL
jgi:hypothetical protein